MVKYTIQNFKKYFPDDNACLDYLFQQNYGDNFDCPKCYKRGKFYRVKKRKTYACQCGQYQISPTADTIFRKSRTKLTLWFYAIFLMSQAKNGVASKELQRHLGVTFKTAFRMNQQIRKLMKDKPVKLEEFRSQVQRSVNGTYHMISPKHRQSYLDQFSFHHSHRDSPVHPFEVLIKKLKPPYSKA